MDLSYETVMKRYEEDKQKRLSELTPNAVLMAEYLNQYKKGRINFHDLDKALNQYGFFIDLKKCQEWYKENSVPHISTLEYKNNNNEVLSFDCYLDVGIRGFCIIKNDNILDDFDFE